MRKFLCAALAAIMLGASAAGCEEKNESSVSGQQMVGNGSMADDLAISEDEMPYGSTVFELMPANDENVKYIIDFDKRYFGGDMENPDLREIYALHDYIAAVNVNDHDKIKSLYYPGYLEYVCEQNGYANVDEYLDSLYSSFCTMLGSDFEIDFIDVSNCLTENDPEAASYFTEADEAVNAVDSAALTKITSKKVAEIGGYTCYSTAEGSVQLINHTNPLMFRVYEIDGQIYLF